MPTTLLNNVSWKTYECLLKDYENSSAPRFTYDRGVLEIMSPLIPHEELNRTVARLVETILEEWNVDYDNLGSTTFKREDVDRGFEPDTCFYIQNVGRLAGRRQADLAGGDPPPDLVIEVDDTNPSLSKLPILAALMVPEMWRVTEGGATILVRDGGEYREQERSTALPRLSVGSLNDLLERSRTLSRLEWVRTVREWARQNAG